MEEPANAFDFLEMLRKQNGKKIQDQAALYRYLGLKAREKGIPVCNQFELTPLCNFSCKMCYVHLNPNQMGGQSLLPTSTWKELMHQSWEAGMLQATLTGGECLTYPGFEELFLYLHSIGCEVSILTNGYLLDDKRIRFFLDHKPMRIQITLYGQDDDVYERVTGQKAFSVVAENARKAIDAGLPISINVTPNVYLGEDVYETIKAARRITPNITINSSIFSPREETGRSGLEADPETDIYIQIYRLINELEGRENKEIDQNKLPPIGGPNHECTECGLRCGGGRSGFVIDWKGIMIPCNRMEMIRSFPLKDGIQSAWEKLNRESNNWPRVAECDGCAYFEVCNNCAGNMLRFAEPGIQPIALCEQTRRFVSNGIRSIKECEE